MWWAHQDSNLGQTDYESKEQSPFFSSNSQNCKEFSFTELPILAETDPYPNRIARWSPTEPTKLKNSNGFLATEIRTETDLGESGHA